MKKENAVEQVLKTIDLIRQGHLTHDQILEIKAKAKMTDAESSKFFFFDYNPK